LSPAGRLASNTRDKCGAAAVSAEDAIGPAKVMALYAPATKLVRRADAAKLSCQAARAA